MKLPEIPEDATPLDAALLYQAAGLHVLPVAAGTKNPGSILGADWERKASNDPAVARGWWGSEAGARRGIGVACGPSGLVVLDVDNPSHPEAPTLADAPSAQSRPGSDRHHLFTAQPRGRRIGCPRVPWGDVRGWGGFVMLAPSRNPDNGNAVYGPVTPGRVPALPPVWAEQFPEKSTVEIDHVHLQDAWESLYGRDWDETDRFLGQRIRERFRDQAGAGRHTALVDAVTWALKAAWAGKINPLPVLDDLHRDFMESAVEPDGRTEEEAEAEYQRTVMYGVAVARSEAVHQGELQASVAEPVEPGAVRVGEWLWRPGEAFKNVERPPEIIRDTLPPIGVGQLIGVTYTGKTYLAVDLVYSLACNDVETWFGREIVSHGGTAYWLLEGGWDFGLRLRAWETHHGKAPDHPLMVVTGPGRVTVPENQERFIAGAREAFAGERLSLIVVDTQSLAFAELSENDNSEMNRMVSACKTISEELGAPVLLVHHASSKGEGGINRRDPGRGATSQRAGMDFVLYAEREGESLGQLQLDKYKAFRPWRASEAYDFRGVDLGTDPNGMRLASAVIVHVPEAARRYASTRMSDESRELDLQIMRALYTEPGRGCAAVARDLGVQAKAVENRILQVLGPDAGGFLRRQGAGKYVPDTDRPFPFPAREENGNT